MTHSVEHAEGVGSRTAGSVSSAPPTDAEPEWGTRRFHQRPTKLSGRTKAIETPAGTAYVIVNFWQSQPVEVFVNLGKAGTQERALTEAIGRLCSSALQHGTPLAELCRQLRGISSDGAFGVGPNKILSVPDAVAQVLEDYID